MLLVPLLLGDPSGEEVTLFGGGGVVPGGPEAVGDDRGELLDFGAIGWNAEPDPEAGGGDDLEGEVGAG